MPKKAVGIGIPAGRNLSVKSGLMPVKQIVLNNKVIELLLVSAYIMNVLG
jgi:hypothetical protein